MLQKQTNVTFYQKREKDLVAFFKTEKYFVYCCDIVKVNPDQATNHSSSTHLHALEALQNLQDIFNGGEKSARLPGLGNYLKKGKQ
jgi:hypothetical protein